jgi:hypothetical protein
MAGLFDILGVRARSRRRLIPSDDAHHLHQDLQRIGEDFRVVLSNIGSPSSK